MRIIREFLNPLLKCNRIGHIPETKRVKIRRDSSKFYNSVEDFKVDIDYCTRCKEKLTEPINEEYWEGFTGCTMPSSYWDEIQENGYLILT